VIDLIVLVADNRMALSVKTILRRNAALNIRAITYEVFAHAKHDPGVLTSAQDFLRPFLRTHSYALVLFDREGCGRTETRERISQAVQANLDVNGWRDRSAVCIFDPELEVWVWSRSPYVAQALGWQSKDRLDSWLTQSGFLQPPTVKPNRPKEAMNAALRHVRLPMSSSIYQRIAAHVSFGQCADPCFLEFAQTLRRWFAVMQ
jgi:hypothetical protein